MRLKQFIVFFFLLLLPLLLGAYSPQTVRISRNLAMSLTAPFLEGSAQIQKWIHDQKDFFIDLLHTREENQHLNDQVGKLKQEISRLREEKEENVRLKKLLKFPQTTAHKIVTAQVIARDISHWTYYATINKGAADGIKPEIPVVTGDGLVGKVVGVSSHSARVILLIDAESRVGAIIQESRDVGLIEGTGESFLRMTYIDLHAQIQVGETVISSGLGDIYPKGIPIGEIVQIGEDKNGLSLYATIKPFASFSKLEEVLCFVSGKTES